MSRDSVRNLICSIMVIVCAIPCNSSSVVIVSHNKDLFVGADGLESGISMNHGNLVIHQPVCKIRQHGAVFVAHVGETRILAQKNAPPIGISFNSDTLIDSAMDTSGTVEAKADALEQRLWKLYGDIVAKIAKMPKSVAKDSLVQMFSISQYAVIGFEPGGGPTAVVIYFANDFSVGNGNHPMKRRIQIPHDQPGAFLGYHEAGDILFGNVPDYPSSIDRFLGSESSIHPDKVGQPFTVLKLSGISMNVIEMGACSYQSK